MNDQELQECINHYNHLVKWTGRGQLITSFLHLTLILQLRTGERIEDQKPLLYEFSKEFGVKCGVIHRRTMKSHWTDAILNFDSEGQRMAFFLTTGIKRPDAYKNRKRNQK